MLGIANDRAMYLYKDGYDFAAGRCKLPPEIEADKDLSYPCGDPAQ